MKKILFFLLTMCSLALAASPVILSDQGTNVLILSTGELLQLGNLTIRIYDAPTGGNLIYEQNFTGAIVNGSWNVVLNNSLLLDFDKTYYKDYIINDDNLNFSGQDRLAFMSPLGDININSNISLGQKINFFLGGIIENIVEDWLSLTGNVNITKNLVVKGNVSISGTTLEVNNTKVCLEDGTNCQSFGGISAEEPYLYFNASKIYFNETKLNGTIDARAGNGTGGYTTTLPASNITGAWTNGIIVPSANITGAWTAGMTLPSSNVTGVWTGGITIPAANISGAITQAQMQGITLPAANITGVIGGETTTLPFSNITGFSVTGLTMANITGAWTNGATLPSSNITGVWTGGVTIPYANVTGAPGGAGVFIPAENITSGTLDDARLSTNISKMQNTTHIIGKISCLNITGGTDADFCVDATGGGSEITTLPASNITGAWTGGITVPVANVTGAITSVSGLTMANITGTWTNGITVPYANITNAPGGAGVTIPSSNVTGVWTGGASLPVANITGAITSVSGLTTKNLTGTDYNCSVSNSCPNVRYTGSGISTIYANITGIATSGLTMANISGAWTNGVTIPIANVSGAWTGGATLPSSNITGVWTGGLQNFPRANITGTMPYANLTGIATSGLTMANITGAWTNGATLPVANITGAWVGGITVPVANLTGIIDDAKLSTNISKMQNTTHIIGKMSCLNLTGGTDTDFCADATGAGGGGGTVNLTTTTCSGSDKVSAIDNATGVVTCTADLTGGPFTTDNINWTNSTNYMFKGNWSSTPSQDRDVYYNNMNFATTAYRSVGTLSIYANASDPDIPSGIQCATAATALADCIIAFTGSTATNIGFFNATKISYFEIRYKLLAVSVRAREDMIGMFYTATTINMKTARTGIFFLHNETLSPNWVPYVCNAGTCSNKSTTVAANNAWHIFTIVGNYRFGKSDNYGFFIDGTYLGNISGNMPTAGVSTLGTWTEANAAVAQSHIVDWVYYERNR